MPAYIWISSEKANINLSVFTAFQSFNAHCRREERERLVLCWGVIFAKYRDVYNFHEHQQCLACATTLPCPGDCFDVCSNDCSKSRFISCWLLQAFPSKLGLWMYPCIHLPITLFHGHQQCLACATTLPCSGDCFDVCSNDCSKGRFTSCWLLQAFPSKLGLWIYPCIHLPITLLPWTPAMFGMCYHPSLSWWFLWCPL